MDESALETIGVVVNIVFWTASYIAALYISRIAQAEATSHEDNIPEFSYRLRQELNCPQKYSSLEQKLN